MNEDILPSLSQDPPRTDPEIVAALMRCPRNLDNITVCGVDLRNDAATVIRFKKRQRRLRQLVGGFDKNYEIDSQKSGNPSAKSGHYIEYLQSRLKWLHAGTDAYMKHKKTNNTSEDANIRTTIPKTDSSERASRVHMNRTDRWMEMDKLRIEQRRSLKSTI
ncbi:hypothetical protein Bhyg_11577 [Pseudolycoriella hygida]|uniref:Uncharacterized protein n=1 Tax=Pseudolycoriella hygida TaxID=35572 RepID=A0A9Q0MX59_9DIPT|nr:hypothetical protein Bhyg_11577 [Pseudolycoriella hygida]